MITLSLITGVSGGSICQDISEYIRHTWAQNYEFTARFITEN